MSSTFERAGVSDLLTRTTLQIDGSISAPSVTKLIAALQRVPGVLLAEVNATTACAIVAHDAAVPPASLLAAVSSAGVHAKIASDTRTPATEADPAVRAQAARLGILLTVGMAFFLLALVDLIVPNVDARRWGLPLFAASLWLFYISSTIIRRRS